MASDNETVAEIVKRVRRDCNSYPLPNAAGEKLKLIREIDDAHKREMADEKRIFDAVIQSMRDKKLEMAGEIAVKDAEISDLRALVKEIADVLNNTNNYMCFHCTVRNCPGENECRDTKKYCLLIAKAGEVIGGAE